MARPRRSAWFADQGPDHVSVVDAPLMSAAQALAAQLELLAVVRLEPIVEDADAKDLADEAGRHRVRAVPHADGAPLADPHMILDVLGQLGDVELAHRLDVVDEPLTPRPIHLPKLLVDEGLPRLGRLEVAATPNQQRLL